MNPRREATTRARDVLAEGVNYATIEPADRIAYAQALATIALAEGIEELGALLAERLTRPSVVIE